MASLDQARAAVGRGEWAHARALLADLPADPPGARAEVLELLATSAYAAGDLDAVLLAWEDAHVLALAAADHDRAARAACMVALHLLIDTGLMSTVRGWLRRAERLLVEEPAPVPTHAVIAMVRTYERFLCGDAAGAEAQAATSIELGLRLDVLPAVVIGRTATGRLRILHGEVEEGLGLLDEVAAHLMSGEVDALTAGMMFCELVCAAQSLGRHDLARDWTSAMDRWRTGAAVGGIHGRCRVHRAELLRLSGPGVRAEQEALTACEELRPWLRREYGWPLVELGTIRLRRGDLDGAEQAFLDAHRHVWSPQPGLALLRLEQGHLAAALELIGEAVAHPEATPSKEYPPFADLRLAPLLSAQAEIAVAAGDLVLARRATEALEDVARRYGETRGLAAAAAAARGRLALLQGDLTTAVGRCAEAAVAWSELDAPYEAAAARVLLGRTRHRAGALEHARLEWRSARDGYAAYGALLRVAAVERLLAESAPPPPASPPPTPPPAPTQVTAAQEAVFTLVGGCRRISFGGVEALVPDLVGLRYLARMLAAPGREFHVLDLVAIEHPRGVAGPPEDLRAGGDGGLPVIDDQARQAYRRRLVELEDEVDDARAMNDLGRLELAERDRDYLMAELASAVGLAGRARSTGSSTERARSSVTRSLRYALARVARHQPELGAHLDGAVRTGTFCSYRPDPVSSVRWDLDAVTR